MRVFNRFIIVIIGIFLVIPSQVLAAPYFFLEGDSVTSTGNDQTYNVKLFTDGNVVTAAQTVIQFDPIYIREAQLSTINSLCSFWAPADPSLGFGNSSTPYISGSNKVVISCGFANPGYQSTTSLGDLILHITFTPISSGSSTLTFNNTQLRYIGTTITPGTSPNFDLTVFGSTVEAAAARPTPRPVASNSATPNPNATVQPSPDILKASDLTLVNVGSSSNSGTKSTNSSTGALNQNLDVVQIDNQIPPPPTDMTPRPKATPFVPSNSTESASPINDGEVLSLQSLRELLIPGKSSADKTLVMFNLISTLTFVTLLAVLIWRMIISSRSNQIKYRHMNELIEGELSVLESKLSGVHKPGESNEIDRTLDDLKKELDKSK